VAGRDQFDTEPGEQGEQHGDGRERRAAAQGPRHHRPAPPGSDGPGGQPGEPDRGPDEVRYRAEAPGVFRVGRHQHARDSARDQDQPPGRARRTQCQRGDDVAEADKQEDQRHHPPVGRADRGQRADRVGHRVEVRLQPGGYGPPAYQQDRSGDR
jgi:hypothetical protein